MIPRLNISFPLKQQWIYWLGEPYDAAIDEYLLNHARTGIVMALSASLPSGGKVGVVTYNCHTVANAVVNAGCTPVFVDITEHLTIDIDSIPTNLDAIVVTNLFGIRNDIEAIRKRCPKAIIIVDNAHGYGLPAEGDFTVYSINQGKFPALGEGGILMLNSDRIAVRGKMDDLYASLPKYSIWGQCKLFITMLIKAIAYSRCVYWLTLMLKKSSHPNVHQAVMMMQMAPGIRRMYRAALPEIPAMIERQRLNAEKISNLGYDTIIGDNAFMAVVRTNDVLSVKTSFAKCGVEAETHFSKAIEWATEYGYMQGSCPMSEKLTHQLLMVPTYKKINIDL